MYVEMDAREVEAGSLLAVMVKWARWKSPDFEDRFNDIVQWAFELSAFTEVMREVGLDGSGTPVSFAPVGRNDGVWVGDALGKSIAEECTPISKQAFEQYWQAATELCGGKVHHRKSWKVTRDELLGLWMTGCFGSHSDEGVAFFPDGTGFAEASNVTLMFYDSFKWECPEPGRVMLHGETHFEQALDCVVQKSPSKLRIERTGVVCTERIGHGGKPYSKLHLDLGVGDYDWVHGPFSRSRLPIEEISWPAFRNRSRADYDGSA